MALRKKTPPMAEKPERLACPKCGRTNDARGVKTVRVDMRPVLTPEVFAFPDALAEASCLKCAGCGYWICLDYRSNWTTTRRSTSTPTEQGPTPPSFDFGAGA
jgi:hypothetical protein